LQYIQEHNISIDEVAGASMGALIAAMYATGVSPQIMQYIFSQVSYSKLFDGSIDMGVFGGKKLTIWLKSIFGTTKIEDCHIPLKIVACDIQTGEKVIFTQ
jgi:NTE family protein